MRGVWAAVAVFSLICAGSAGAAPVSDIPKAPVDRTQAIGRAARFLDRIEAALTQPRDDLYLRALRGSADDKWRYALALVAGRYSLDAMPAAQREIYGAYNARAAAAREAYIAAHPDEDISEKNNLDFAPPTPEELQAINIANGINSVDQWFARAGRERNGVAPAIDPAVLAQSRECLEGVKAAIDGDSLADQLMAALTPPGGELPPDLLAAMQSDKTTRTEYEREQETLCGGAEAFEHITALMKAVYEPALKITVTTHAGDKAE